MLNLTKSISRMEYGICHKCFVDLRKVLLIGWYYLTKCYEGNSEVIVKIALALETSPIPKRGLRVVTNGVKK